jgi:CRISPR system Cascade subunit CasE
MTRMKLDITRRSTMKALSSPNLFHGAVESAFAGERKRNLWRIDRLGENYYLLLVSPDRPDLSTAAEQFGGSDPDEKWLVKDYSQFLEKIKAGQTWRFKLTSNPTISCVNSRDKTSRGQIHAHITTEYQSEWLIRQAQKHGFSLNPDEFLVTGSKWLHFIKSGKNHVTLLEVTFEGLLKVTDADLFRQSLCKGIGRGKAYGMGLLTVVRESGGEHSE